MIIVEQLMAYYIYIVLDSVFSAVVIIIYVYLYLNVDLCTCIIYFQALFMITDGF